MGPDKFSLREPFDRSRPDFPPGTPLWSDPSFELLLDRCPELRPVLEYLPLRPGTGGFDGQSEIENVWSAYQDHGYGHFFYALTRVLRPRRCVELGVLGGFSLSVVAAALRDNGNGSIQGFDIFEQYPYHHERWGTVKERLEALGLLRWSAVHLDDATTVHERFDEIDYLHVDVSNEGDVYRWAFRQWAGKVSKAILLEGGSSNRDQVEWMKKYAKSPIAPAIEEIREAYPEWIITVLEPFPSVTVAIRSGAAA